MKKKTRKKGGSLQAFSDIYFNFQLFSLVLGFVVVTVSIPKKTIFNLLGSPFKILSCRFFLIG